MEAKTKIGKYFTYGELTYADISILKRINSENKPNDKQLANIKTLVEKVLDPLREGLDHPIFISSGFRSKEYNALINGSSPSSQHTSNKGSAVDIDMDALPKSEIKNIDVFNYIKDNLDFDQLIWEHGDILNPAWVHVSYFEGKNRKQILKAIKINNVTAYLKWK